MKKCLSLTLGLIVGALLIWAAQSNGDSRTLRVTVHYTGSGTVDANHPIAIALWDSPSFMEPNNNSMPADVQTMTSNGASVTFSNVKASPAYVSAAYDPSGKWDAKSGPPPTGSSLGLYSKEPNKPERVTIAAGKTASIHFSFDDSVKMK